MFLKKWKWKKIKEIYKYKYEEKLGILVFLERICYKYYIGCCYVYIDEGYYRVKNDLGN